MDNKIQITFPVFPDNDYKKDVVSVSGNTKEEVIENAKLGLEAWKEATGYTSDELDDNSKKAVAGLLAKIKQLSPDDYEAALEWYKNNK